MPEETPAVCRLLSLEVVQSLCRDSLSDYSLQEITVVVYGSEMQQADYY